MGTEIFPQLQTILQVVVAIVILTAMVVVGVSLGELRRLKKFNIKSTRAHDHARSHITSSLIAIAIVVLAYFILSAIGPTLNVLF